MEGRWRPKPGTLGGLTEQGLPPGVRGCGSYDPETGLYEWYEGAEDLGGSQDQGLGWSDVLQHWRLIEADFHSEYGVDLSSGILRARSYRWLRVRIEGLLAADTRLYRKLRPPEKDEQQRQQY